MITPLYAEANVSSGDYPRLLTVRVVGQADTPSFFRCVDAEGCVLIVSADRLRLLWRPVPKAPETFDTPHHD